MLQNISVFENFLVLQFSRYPFLPFLLVPFSLTLISGVLYWIVSFLLILRMAKEHPDLELFDIVNSSKYLKFVLGKHYKKYSNIVVKLGSVARYLLIFIGANMVWLLCVMILIEFYR